jgi:hypothetical protein
MESSDEVVEGRAFVAVLERRHRGVAELAHWADPATSSLPLKQRYTAPVDRQSEIPPALITVSAPLTSAMGHCDRHANVRRVCASGTGRRNRGAAQLHDRAWHRPR